MYANAIFSKAKYINKKAEEGEREGVEKYDDAPTSSVNKKK